MDYEKYISGKDRIIVLKLTNFWLNDNGGFRCFRIDETFGAANLAIPSFKLRQ